MPGNKPRNVIRRGREWYARITTPESVEKAPLRERLKRDTWQIGSLILAMVGVFASFYVTEVVVRGVPGGVGPAVIAWFLLDQRLFSWGFERFDLVAPWQFRDAEVDGNGE